MYNRKAMALRYIVTLILLCSYQVLLGGDMHEIYFKVTIHARELGCNSSGEDLEDDVILKLPAGYAATGTPTRLIYMAHGAGGGVTHNSWFLNQFELQQLLLDNGFALFDVQGGRIENMGGERVVKSAYKAWQHIVENYNVHPEILVAGFSMGGLSSTNFVLSYGALVLAHVMYCPVLDLYEQAWKNPWLKSTRKALAEEYCFSDPTGEAYDFKATAGRNPIEPNRIAKNGEQMKLYPVPVKIWHASRDRVVTVESSRILCREIRSTGGKAELVEIDSDDHGLSCGNPSMNLELLEFIKPYK